MSSIESRNTARTGSMNEQYRTPSTGSTLSIEPRNMKYLEYRQYPLYRTIPGILRAPSAYTKSRSTASTPVSPHRKQFAPTPTRGTICECFLQNKGHEIIDKVHRWSKYVLHTLEYTGHILRVFWYTVLFASTRSTHSGTNGRNTASTCSTCSTESRNASMTGSNEPRNTASPEISAVENLEYCY